MATKIRLSRGGSKKRPYYRIVVADANSPRDGRFIERLGSYNPMLPQDHAERLLLKTERIQYWLSVGAQPSNAVRVMIKIATRCRRWRGCAACGSGGGGGGGGGALPAAASPASAAAAAAAAASELLSLEDVAP